MTGAANYRQPRPDAPSGEQLVDELYDAARSQGVQVSMLVRRLTRSMGTSNYIDQLRRTKCPRQTTVDRVRAVIAGEAVFLPPSHMIERGGPRRGPMRQADRRVSEEVIIEAHRAADRRRLRTRLTTAHPVQIDHRERTLEERLAEASDIVRFAITEWPDIAREVKAYADESSRTLADAWRSVITAGLQCLREAD